MLVANFFCKSSIYTFVHILYCLNQQFIVLYCWVCDHIFSIRRTEEDGLLFWRFCFTALVLCRCFMALVLCQRHWTLICMFWNRALSDVRKVVIKLTWHLEATLDSLCIMHSCMNILQPLANCQTQWQILICINMF